jgi:hypothetical protein
MANFTELDEFLRDLPPTWEIGNYADTDARARGAYVVRTADVPCDLDHLCILVLQYSDSDDLQFSVWWRDDHGGDARSWSEAVRSHDARLQEIADNRAAELEAQADETRKRALLATIDDVSDWFADELRERLAGLGIVVTETSTTKVTAQHPTWDRWAHGSPRLTFTPRVSDGELCARVASGTMHVWCDSDDPLDQAIAEVEAFIARRLGSDAEWAAIQAEQAG